MVSYHTFKAAQIYHNLLNKLYFFEKYYFISIVLNRKMLKTQKLLSIHLLSCNKSHDNKSFLAYTKTQLNIINTISI